MRISFIILCYNVSKTVLRCLDSIYSLGLSESEFEVVAINDASTDDTLKIVREYAERHPNLVVVNHLDNRNLGASRNSGLAVAKGNSIAFVDSDDEVGPGVINALSMMEEKQLDMVAMRLEIIEDSSIQTLSLPYSPEQVFTGVQLQERIPFWSVSVWSFLYAKELIDRIVYPFVEGVYYEDVDFVCKHLFYTIKMSYCADCGYRYYRNSSSITQSFSPRHAFCFAFLGIRVLSLFSSLNDKSPLFAKSLMEYGNIMLVYSFRHLFRLGSFAKVNAFYNMIDSTVNRRSVLRMNGNGVVFKWPFLSRFWLRCVDI